MALGSVKRIYLIADTHNGQLCVGKADGADGRLGRWREYATNGHGGNTAMVPLATLDPTFPLRCQFSLLQVFSPTTPPAEILASEEHVKRALIESGQPASPPAGDMWAVATATGCGSVRHPPG